MTVKHRDTLFAVVREKDDHEVYGGYEFSALTGVFKTLERAEEIAGAHAQAMKEAHAPRSSPYIFTVHPVTYYDE